MLAESVDCESVDKKVLLVSEAQKDRLAKTNISFIKRQAY
jgi:hypothetical protein